MPKSKGLEDDIIKAIKRAISANKKKTGVAKPVGKLPPQPPKRKPLGTPPAVGSKGTGKISKRGGMTSKELDDFTKKTYSDSRNYYQDAKKALKDIEKQQAKNKPRNRGDYR